jgi:hypothetical protein
MIIYDVNSFPDGVDISIWYSLFEKGLAIYDSLRGEKPFILDGELSLVDIRNMTPMDMDKVSEYLVAINEKYAKENEMNVSVVRENNRKLVEYLKKINDETV